MKAKQIMGAVIAVLCMITGTMHAKKRLTRKQRNAAAQERAELAKQEQQLAALPKNISVPSYPHEHLEIVDQIKTVIFGPEETDIITQSSINRPGIDGSVRSEEDIILERLMVQDAKKYKMMPDDDAIDKHLKAVQRENNLTMEQMHQIFEQAGYTYEEGRKQFGDMTAVQQVVGFKVQSNAVMVPEKEIQKYYDEHPVYLLARYQLERAFVPYSKMSNKEKLKERLLLLNEKPRAVREIEWGEPFWINKDDLAQEMRFIHEMQPGDISKPIARERGYDLFKLLKKEEKRIMPLEDRRLEIINTLREPRYMGMLDNYKKELMNDASIVHY